MSYVYDDFYDKNKILFNYYKKLFWILNCFGFYNCLGLEIYKYKLIIKEKFEILLHQFWLKKKKLSWESDKKSLKL